MIKYSFYWRWLMGDSRKVFAVTIISVILFSTGLIGSSAEAFSDKKFKTNTIQLIHLGD